jgi:hypothetical protein
LVKQELPDGTPVDAVTMADVAVDAGGVQVGILGAALNTAQRKTITTWLTSQGLDTSWINSTMITRQLFLFGLLRYLAQRPDLDLNAILSSYNVA